MIIRPMEPEDADSVAQIEKDSFTQPWSRQGFLDAMRLPENIMLVAQEDGEILGYQCTYVSFDEGELTNIAVKKSARGKGKGSHHRRRKPCKVHGYVERSRRHRNPCSCKRSTRKAHGERRGKCSNRRGNGVRRTYRSTDYHDTCATGC